jgi:aminoglycoside phosphotransferase
MALAELERPVRGPDGRASALRLYRAWPEGPARLALEYRDEVGRVVSGHWFATGEAAREALRPVRRRTDLEVERLAAAGGLVALYPPGDDALLKGLRPAVERPGSELLSHRPWRRASVKLDSGSGPSYAKVMRPRRAAQVAERARQATDLAAGAFATPRLRAVEEDGVLIFDEVAGARLLEVVRGEGRDRALAALGEALRALHDAQPAESLAPYPHVEAARRLVDHAEAVESLAPAASSQLAGLARSIGARLEPPVGPPAPLHRDLNGTNMRITEAGGVGILDFDQLTLGDPAIDLGGALARLVGNIESFQRPLEEELAASAAFLDGYRPAGALLKRAEGHFRATLVQGACGCVLRPAGRPHLPALTKWAADERGLSELLRGTGSGV